MRFVLFKTPKPRQFRYKPRYYDEEKERLEKRKAELGLNSELSEREALRIRMRSKWRKGSKHQGSSNLSRLIYFGFYAFVVIGGVYLIFFTDFVEKLITLFGV